MKAGSHSFADGYQRGRGPGHLEGWGTKVSCTDHPVRYSQRKTEVNTELQSYGASLIDLLFTRWPAYLIFTGVRVLY